ncbi:hypothetical protein LCGC14_1349120 [marine sediment metagenome]|uniref:DNA methylase N-4/N-6 domain-containing protein n=2 Tax=marine sediment metagenome TaxID=412755 RepID=A0A0F9NDQ0_9ZZZZ
MDKVFAAQYERVREGEMDLIMFPGRDTTWRRRLFPGEVFNHPAKANLYLIKELVEYLTQPGDTIIDPFAGTGTLLIGALMGRNIALIEVEPQYLNILEQTQQMWKEGIDLGVELEPYLQSKGPGRIMVYEGDCRQKLQDIEFLCDAAIFSPPYANTLSSGGETRTRDSDRITPGAIQSYGGKQASSLNLGRLNKFYFHRGMVRVYQRLHSRLVDGARIAIISKDNMQAGVRQFLSTGIIDQATKNGFKLEEWLKWKQPMSSYRAPAAAKGLKTIDDEDILILRKVG